MEEFARVLRTLIQRDGLTYDDVASDLHISRGSVQNWIYAKHQPTLEMIVELADYFGCTVDKLLGREDFEEWELDTGTYTQQKN